MTEIERMQRFIRIVATMPPPVQQALAIFLEWLAKQDKTAAESAKLAMAPD